MSEVYPEDLRFIYENEELILSLSEEIDQTLGDNLIEHKNPSRTIVIRALEYVFSIQSDTDSANQLANQLASVIITYDSGSINTLQDMGASDELIRFLTGIASKYQSQVHGVVLKKNQGKRFWKNISTEYTLDNKTGASGIRHELENGKNEEFTLTASVESHMRLVSVLLDRQIGAIETFDQELIDQATYNHIETLEEQVEQLREIKESHLE